MLSSSTGIVVPTIFDSIERSSLKLRSVAVVRVDHPPPRSVWRRIARAIVADSDHQHLGVDRLESMPLLEVVLQLGDELFLDVHHTAADLADRVVVVA